MAILRVVAFVYCLVSLEHVSPVAATAALPTAALWIHEGNPLVRLYYSSASMITIDGTGIDCGAASDPPGVASCLNPAFLPALTKNLDYSVLGGCCSGTQLKLTLITGKTWRPTPGPLYLEKIRSGDAYTLDPPALVAQITNDPVVTGTTHALPFGNQLLLDISHTGLDAATLARFNPHLDAMFRSFERGLINRCFAENCPP